MPLENVTVIANGVIYSGWESVMVVWDATDPLVRFQLSTTEIGGLGIVDASGFDIWNFPPGTYVQILGNGTPLVAGIIDVYQPQVNADQHTITVTGITFRRDLVDSTVDHKTGVIEDKNDTEVAQEIAKTFGIKLKIQAKPEMVPIFRIRQGATGFAEIMRVLQHRAKMLVAEMPSGELVVTDGKPFAGSGGAALVQGVNIKEMMGRLDAKMHYLYEATGQSPTGTKIEHLESYGVAYNPAIPQTRKKRIVDQGISTPKLAQKRAEWERARELGAATQAVITSPGWRDGLGMFWPVFSDVYVYAPWLKIDCWLRTIKIVWTQDLASGTQTTLTLVDPRAVGLDTKAAACKSGGIWNVPWSTPKGVGPGAR